MKLRLTDLETLQMALKLKHKSRLESRIQRYSNNPVPGLITENCVINLANTPFNPIIKLLFDFIDHRYPQTGDDVDG